MKAKVLDLDQKEVEDITLSEEVFGMIPSESLLNLVVNWQRSKRQAGTHQVKGRSDVSGTTRKPHKQKGTGKARLGSLRAAQCRGGGIIFGPQSRSHEFKLPKKVRKLGLKMALSAKFAEGKLKFIDTINQEMTKTKEVSSKLGKFYSKSLLIIDNFENEQNQNFVQSARNISNVDVLWQIGTNVLDLLKHDEILITKDAVKILEERLV